MLFGALSAARAKLIPRIRCGSTDKLRRSEFSFPLILAGIIGLEPMLSRVRIWCLTNLAISQNLNSYLYKLPLSKILSTLNPANYGLFLLTSDTKIHLITCSYGGVDGLGVGKLCCCDWTYIFIFLSNYQG